MMSFHLDYSVFTVFLSVCPSVRHTLILCQNEWTYHDAVFAVG